MKSDTLLRRDLSRRIQIQMDTVELSGPWRYAEILAQIASQLVQWSLGNAVSSASFGLRSPPAILSSRWWLIMSTDVLAQARPQPESPA